MALRAEFPGIPNIAMSGGVSRSPHYLGIVKKLGARHVLAKPFTPAELLCVVDEVLATVKRGEKPLAD